MSRGGLIVTKLHRETAHCLVKASKAAVFQLVRHTPGRFVVLHLAPAVPTEVEIYISCIHYQELGRLADLASDWLFTLVQPIRSCSLLDDPTLDNDYNS